MFHLHRKQKACNKVNISPYLLQDSGADEDSNMVSLAFPNGLVGLHIKTNKKIRYIRAFIFISRVKEEG